MELRTNCLFIERQYAQPPGDFRSDSGITLSFGEQTYFIESTDPFHNIALKALEQGDPFLYMLRSPGGKALGPPSETPCSVKSRELSGSEDRTPRNP